MQQSVPVPREFLGGTLQFIRLSGHAVKRAGEQIRVYEQLEKRAEAVRGPVLQHLVRSGLVDADQVKAAEALLASHEGTLQVLKQACDLLVEARAAGAQKAASALGSGVADPAAPAAGLPGGYNSLTNNQVGVPTSELKESDRLLLEAAGIHR
jgi:hypothetical protein